MDGINYHGLTKTGMKRLPQAIADSPLVIRASGYDGRVIAFTSLRDEGGRVVIAPIQLNGRGNWNDVEIDANILTTAYGKDEIKGMIARAVAQGDVLYLDKKRSRDLEQTVGLQLPKNLNGKASSTSSIRDLVPNVNSISENSENFRMSLRNGIKSGREALIEDLELDAPEGMYRAFVGRYRAELDAYKSAESDLKAASANLQALYKERREAGIEKKGLRAGLLAEIAQGKSDAQAAREKIDRAEKEIFRLEAMTPMRALIEARTKTAVEARRKQDRIALAEYKENRKDYAESTRYRARVTEEAETLMRWLTANSQKEHVPESLKVPLGELLDALNLSSKRRADGGDATKRDLRLDAILSRVRDAVSRARQASGAESGGDYEGFLDLPPEFDQNMQSLIESLQEAKSMSDVTDPVAHMSGARLKRLYELLRALSRSIRDMNSLYENRLYKRAGEVARATMREMSEKKARKGKRSAFEAASDALDWGNTKPIYAFERMGEAAKSVYQELQDAESRFAMNADMILKFARGEGKEKGAFSGKQAKAWQDETLSFTLDALPGEEGDTVSVQMTAAQVMSLGLLARRGDAALRHIYAGGIRVGQYKGQSGESATQSVMMDEARLSEILKSLTPEQLEVMNAISGFLNGQSSVWGNEVRPGTSP